MKRIWVCLLSLIIALANAAEKKIDPALVPIQEAPNLPRVLLIGDSISMGYTLPIRAMLKGKANVVHPPDNCGDSGKGVQSLTAWLGDKKWDVIHVNFGLHDLKYLDETGKLVAPDKGKQVNLLDQYEKNLRELATKLKATGAKVIWANTTPVPEGSSGRVKDSEAAYNDTAAKVMKENGIEIDDLHALVKAKPELQLPKNVHFSAAGSKALAEEVVKHIESGLKK
ncbi:MAG: SGNH/GDSL hydrolase family protein [Planctomycetota bacterium]